MDPPTPSGRRATNPTVEPISKTGRALPARAPGYRLHAQDGFVPRATNETDKVSLVVGGALHDIYLRLEQPAEGTPPAMQAFARALARSAARTVFRTSEAAPQSPASGPK